MENRRFWASSALLALLFSGCGTAANTVWLTPEEGGKRVYGGVRADWQHIELAAVGKSGIWVDGEEVVDRKRQLGQLVFFTLDLPLSAFADTIALPYTLTSDRELRGWRCIYEPTVIPKSLNEEAGATSP